MFFTPASSGGAEMFHPAFSVVSITTLIQLGFEGKEKLYVKGRAKP
jgi:hypothetical protein